MVKYKNSLTLRKSWNDSQFKTKGVQYYVLSKILFWYKVWACLDSDLVGPFQSVGRGQNSTEDSAAPIWPVRACKIELQRLGPAKLRTNIQTPSASMVKGHFFGRVDTGTHPNVPFVSILIHAKKFLSFWRWPDIHIITYSINTNEW